MQIIPIQWKSEKLHKYDSGAMKAHWSASERAMYSKWCYLYKRIKDRANNGNFARHEEGDKIKLSARSLESERTTLQLSMYQFLVHLKKTDKQTQTRKRKRTNP